MQRVAVVGCSGVGKTTFSRRLAEKTGLPLVHLDYYHHELGKDYPHNRAAWVKRVKPLIAEPSWVMDGNYQSTFPLRFARADTIIFFDYPRWRALLGIYKRRFQYRKTRRADMPEGWQEKIPRDFLMFVWKFNRDYRPNIISALDAVEGKRVIVFHKPKEAEQYLRSL
jgi:adenylate kinase family enzyme